jgi:tetratricopeptide (TPR) repeat protein
MKDIADVIGSLYTSSSNFNTKFDGNLPYTFIKNLDMEKVVEYSNRNNFEYSWALEMYYRLIMMELDSSNNDHFYRLKELFEKNLSVFQYEEKFTWTTVLSNYCITMVNEGKESFRQICFDIDKFRLKEGLLFQGKYMPKLLFVRIVANAARLNEIDWGIKYIEDYIHVLKPSYQKQIQALSYATMYFKMKEYDKVINNLSKVKFIDTIDKIYVKSFYLRTYYELGETETLLNNIDSAKHFFNKEITLGNELKNNYIRFVNYLYKMIMAKINNDEFEIDKLRKTVAEDKSIPSHDWMMEKVTELKIET